jgi:hypothetical protein
MAVLDTPLHTSSAHGFLSLPDMLTGAFVPKG